MAQQNSSNRPLPKGMPASTPRAMNGKAASTSTNREESPEDVPSPIGEWLGEQSSWLMSMVVHTIALLILSLIPMLDAKVNEAAVVVATPDAEERLDEEKERIIFCPAPPEEEPVYPDFVDQQEAPSSEVEAMSEPEGANAPPPTDDKWSDTKMPEKDWTKKASGTGDGDDLGTGKGPFGTGVGIGSRIERGNWDPSRRPTPDTEAAVDKALKWLAEHQLPDGSWSFDHRDGGQCQGRCKNHGSFKAAKNGATGLALLTFMGAGQTHLHGKYTRTVNGGLKFLLSTQKPFGNSGGSWHEAVQNATNYSHGLATLAMCEAYAMAREAKMKPKGKEKSRSEMTEEERKAAKQREAEARRGGAAAVPLATLQKSAKAALNYIVEQQHSAGGWRYNPGQPGDTSVVGWMLMALKSGHMSQLRVATGTVVGASKFLDSVAHDEYGSIYHYLPDKARPVDSCRATTAIGLLCRMYLGWSKDHPGIGQGVGNVSNWGPSTAANMYYNYYATQVMFHYGGEPWIKWNKTMRDFLVNSQAKGDHEMGSWHFAGGDHGSGAGGRLYCTALAAMTLEVYYRYMPIYQAKSIEEDLAKPAEK